MGSQYDRDTLYARARAIHDQGDFKELARIAKELLELSAAQGDHTGMARAENFLGNCALYAVDGDAAERHYRSALEHFQSVGDRLGEGIIALNLGCIAADINMDTVLARTLWEKSLAIFRELGDSLRTGIALADLGELNRLEGDYTKAYALGTEALGLFEELADQVRCAWQRINIAHYHILKRDYAEAIDELRLAFTTLRAQQNPEQVANYFETWFILAVDMQRYTSAARIVGFLDRYRTENRVARLPSMMPWFTPRFEKLQKQLYQGDLETWREEGEAMTLEEAEACTHCVLVTTA